jgi:uncharacterized OB-fold protein
VDQRGAELSIKQTPIQDGLYTWPSKTPQLIGSKCAGCGEVAFPKQGSCPNCTGTVTDEILLARRGTLWTWTIQHFPPPSPPYIGDPESFVPFGVGYIELPEGVRVEARLTESDPSKLEIGMPMELVIEKFVDDDERGALMTFAFQPATD